MQTIAQTWVEEGRQQGLEQGLEQGMRQGLLNGIRLGLDLRFGAEGLRLWPEIAKLKDIYVLNAICEGIRTVDTLADLRRIYHVDPSRDSE